MDKESFSDSFDKALRQVEGNEDIPEEARRWMRGEEPQVTSDDLTPAIVLIGELEDPASPAPSSLSTPDQQPESHAGPTNPTADMAVVPGRNDDECHEDTILCALVVFFRDILGEHLLVVDNPDRHGHRRDGQRACDAILGDAERCPRVAVECTEMFPYHKKKWDDDLFLRSLDALDRDPNLESLTPCHTQLAVRALTIPKRCVAEAFRENVRVILTAILPDLRPGDWRSFCSLEWKSEFHLRTISQLSGRGFHVMRVAPADLEGNRREVFIESLRRKADQLKGYKDHGLRTLLLVHSNDGILTNVNLAQEAFNHASADVPEVALIDEVVLIETDTQRWHISFLGTRRDPSQLDQFWLYDPETQTMRSWEE